MKNEPELLLVIAASPAPSQRVAYPLRSIVRGARFVDRESGGTQVATRTKALTASEKSRGAEFFLGMCGSGIVKGTASPGAFGLFADGSGFFGRAVKNVTSAP